MLTSSFTKRAFVAILVLLVFSAPALSATFNVSDETAIQMALNAASNNGQADTINVSSGTINLTSDLTYTASASENFALDIIGSGSSSSVLSQSNTFRVLTIDTTALSSDSNADITIKDLGIWDGEASLVNDGGGIHVSTGTADVTVEDCRFNSNYSFTNGGGLFVDSTSGAITVTDCDISENACPYGRGAGAYLSGGAITIEDCIIDLNNITFEGDAVGAYINGTTVTITGTSFSNNTAVDMDSYGAGGILVFATTSVVLTDNTFDTNASSGTCYGVGAYVGCNDITATDNIFSNNVGYFGGGVYFDGDDITLAGNIFTGNTGNDGAGALISADHTVSITNNLFTGNIASGAISVEGGGMKMFLADPNPAASTGTIAHNTFTGNSAVEGGGMYIRVHKNNDTLDITNNILWGNTATTGDDIYLYDDGDVDGSGATVNITYNDISEVHLEDGDNTTQSDNIDSDPQFVGGGNYHLTGSSPCIDTGTDASVTDDIDDDMRPYGSGYDMGYDEFTFDTIGVVRGRWWYLDYNGSRAWDAGTDSSFVYGLVTDTPVCGDWNGDGEDEAGFVRDGWWYLDVTGDDQFGVGDVSFKFGQASDTPVVGDWNGDGTDDPGVFRNGWWFLDADGNRAWDSGPDWYFKYGQPTDTPVPGDWDGDGDDEAGVFRARWWFLDSDSSYAWNAAGDSYFKFGRATDLPLVCDWDGDGDDDVGVFRARWWYLDSNGNDAWDVGTDAAFKFGLATDTPIAGKW